MQEHEKWLFIAREDLKAAQGMFKLELFSTVAYHCQQAAEKSLKAYLAYKNYPVEKTHDLAKLVGACQKNDYSFTALYDIAEQLTPFATRFRYPTEFDIPDSIDSKEAVRQARTIFNFVVKKIAMSDSGQISFFDEM